MIVAKINLSRIPKDKIFTGEKGKYIDLVIVKKKEVDQYGHTHFVAISQTKEERDAKADTVFVGQAVEVGAKIDKEEIVNVGNANSEDLIIDEPNDDLPF